MIHRVGRTSQCCHQKPKKKKIKEIEVFDLDVSIQTKTFFLGSALLNALDGDPSFSKEICLDLLFPSFIFFLLSRGKCNASFWRFFDASEPTDLQSLGGDE